MPRHLPPISSLPKLVLLVKGTRDPGLDRARLKEPHLHAAIAKGMGLRLAEGEEAPPVSTANPKVQDVMESMYESKIGKAELKAPKARYYQANPAKQPAIGKGSRVEIGLSLGVAGKPVSQTTSNTEAVR